MAYPLLFSRAQNMNLVLISIDTLRADRLGAYGYPHDVSPVIDQLAAESVVFENVVTPAPWTLPAHVSMLTGLYPKSHGMQRRRDRKISHNDKLLAELLKKNHYETLAITGGGFVSKSYGFNRGFDFFKESRGVSRDPVGSINKSVETAISKLSEVNDNQPFFLFLHSYDVHCPYTPPDEFFGTVRSPNASEIESGHCGEAFYNKRNITAENALYLSDRYDDSIRAVDAALKKLFRYFKSRQDYDRTIIVLTSDHGEEFFEHGRIGHQNSIYKELLFVPLIVRAPNVAHRRVTRHVSLVDIVPTVTKLLNIEFSNPIDGISLVPAMRKKGASLASRPFEFSELHMGEKLYSRIDASTQLIFDVEKDKYLLFDIKHDPLESNNLATARPDEVNEKSKQLLAFIDAKPDKLGGTNGAAEAESSDDEDAKVQVERLKSLGYV